jgi:hypothetical protein
MNRIVLVIGSLIAFLASHSAHAQVTIEVGKITCKQFLAYNVADPRDIAIWFSGYYHGKRSDTTLDTQEFKENLEKLKSACYSNYDVPVMQVIEKAFLAPSTK